MAVLVGGGAFSAAEAVEIDPGTLARGENPSVVYLVRDTIRDGALEVPAPSLGKHQDLWTVAGGYVVSDVVSGRPLWRLVFVDPTGGQRLIARRHSPLGTAVSPDGRRLAWGKALGPDPGPPSVVKVVVPRTGRVVAVRRFHFATVLGVSDHRVLLNLMNDKGRSTTWWWNYRHDTMAKLADQPGIRADLVARRVVLGVGGVDSFCQRVAPLDHPARTLWRSCISIPRAWSPNGRLTLSTYTYFDDTGVPRWVVKRDPSGVRIGRVTGRLGWDAVWEDDTHYLLLAQGDDGKASIVRCSTSGDCERASRLWSLEVPDYLPYFISPPVVLPNN